MTCWRLVKSRRADQVLSGDGSRMFGGRWNHPGSRIVYASSTLSLAALEVFVRLHGHEASMSFAAVQLSIPDDVVEDLSRTELPNGWRSSPAHDACKDLGSTWARTQRSLALIVPSIIVPQETNILICVDHPLYKRVKVSSTEEFVFDERLWEK